MVMAKGWPYSSTLYLAILEECMSREDYAMAAGIVKVMGVGGRWPRVCVCFFVWVRGWVQEPSSSRRACISIQLTLDRRASVPGDQMRYRMCFEEAFRECSRW